MTIFAIVKALLNKILLLLPCLFTNYIFGQFQSSWQQQVNYEIDVELDTALHELNGWITMDYHNNSPNELKVIYMHVWPNAYRDVNTPFARQMAVNGDFSFHWAKAEDRGEISGMDFQADGQRLSYKELIDTPDVIVVQLAQPLKPGSSLTINTPFKVKIPKLFSRMGRKGNFYSITQWYPKPAVYDVNGWNYMPYLNQGEFYSEYGRFNVTIRVPGEYKVAATGNLVVDSTGSKGSIFKYEESNIHDFAWFASSTYKTYTTTSVLKTGDTITLNLFAAKGDDKSKIFGDMEFALDHYSTKVGPYPYKTCKVVLGPLEAGGGMEYPTITICQESFPKAVIHEVGHNWFYGILGSNERRYPWMDESINSYFDNEVDLMTSVTNTSEIKADENFYTPINRKSQFNHIEQKILRHNQTMGMNQAIDLASADYTDANYGSMIYLKGKFAFAYLKQALGEDMFYKCFQNYFQEWKYKHPLPGDMQRSFEKTSGMSLDWFFKDLLSDVNAIDYKKKGKKVIVSGPDSIRTYLKGVADAKGKINPYGFLMERSLYNNGQKKKLVQVSFPVGIPTYNSQTKLNIMPFIGYNIYDGLYPLLTLTNAILNDRAFEYQLMPAYSTKANRFIGYGQLLWRRANRHSMGNTEIGVQGKSYGMDEIGESVRYFKLKPFASHKWYGGVKGRHSVVNQLTVSMTYTGLDKTNYLGYIDTLGARHYFNFNSDLFFNYYAVKFTQDWRWQLNRLTLDHNAEYGTNNKFNPGSTAYMKLWTDIVYSYYIKKNKKFKSEFFGGYFPYKKGVFNDQKFYISGNSGNQDYTYSETMMGRNENFSSDLMIGRQIINRGGLRQILGLQGSSDWMLTLRNDVDFPGKLPIAFYFDMGYYRYQNIINVVGGQRIDTKVEFCYTGGIQVNLFKNILQVFFPIINSDQFKQYNQIDTSFINTIGFRLNLRSLDPIHLINGVTTTNKLMIGE